MTLPVYEVRVYGFPSSAPVNDVISFNCKNGRNTKTDVYASSTGSITFRNPSALTAGAIIGVYTTIQVNGRNVYSGYITNIQYNYGIKTTEDTATITLEGMLSFMGRGYLNGFTLTGTTTGAQAQRVGTSLSGSAKSINNIGTKSLTDTSSYSGAAQNMITALVAMEQGRLVQGAASLSVLGRDVLQDPTANPYNYFDFKFTDVLPVTSGVTYDAIEFANLTDNYFTQTTVTPASVAPQFAGTGDRNLQISTYDPTTTQADALADYMLAEFVSNTSAPVSISTRNSLTWTFDPAQMISANPIGWRLPITFRGTTYQAVIEGWSISGSPDDVRYTFMVSDYEENNFLKLNDSLYGRLNYNKLGF